MRSPLRQTPQKWAVGPDTVFREIRTGTPQSDTSRPLPLAIRSERSSLIQLSRTTLGDCEGGYKMSRLGCEGPG